MRKVALYSTLAAIAGSLAFVTPALAGPCGGGREGGGGPEGRGGYGPRHERALEKADLAPATADAVREIFAAAREAHAPLRGEMRQLRAELHELLGQDVPDPEAIAAQADAIGAALAASAKVRAATLLEVRNAVTADEWQRLSSVLMKKHHKRHRGHSDF